MQYLVVGVVVALLIVLSYGRYEYLRQRAARSVKPWRHGAQSDRDLLLPLDVYRAERLARDVLHEYGCERGPADSGERTIEVVTWRKWSTSGYVIRVRLREAVGGTSAAVSAWPGAALFDFGGSRRLVDSVARELIDPPRATHTPI